MSSSKYKKKTTISTFHFRINYLNLSLTKVFKDLRILIVKNFEWENYIKYLYWIAATTFFQDLDSFKSMDINILNFSPFKIPKKYSSCKSDIFRPLNVFRYQYIAIQTTFFITILLLN